MRDMKRIITLPHRSLRQRSKRVAIVTDETRQLIANMEAATLKWEDAREHEVGVALAAVQVNKLLRVVIIRNNFDDKSDRTFSAFVNPEVAKYEGDVVEDYEGCLSIKDVYGKVPRHTKVRIKALDQNGKPVRLTAIGFLARIFQHEIDHTNGVVFIDHIKDNAEAFYHLNSKGHLEPVDYDKFVKNSKTLWA